MRIGILTYYNVHNYGSALQANALRMVLEKMGHTCELLTFERNYDFISSNQVKKYKISFSSIPFYLNYIKKNGIKNVVFNIRKKRILKRYLEENLYIGEHYSNFSKDIVIIGSDEVFSIEIGLNAFFYGHSLQCEKKISYAASFGPTNLEDIYKREAEKLISSGISGLDAISVRDENSYKIVKELTGREAQIVCDPVILYAYAKEQELFKPSNPKYLVIYAYDKNMNTEKEINDIKKFAVSQKMEILSLGYCHGWCNKNILCNPEELLGWIKNASLIITDTFHGGVLSLICKKNFVIKIRNNKNKLYNLMKEYGLEDRIVSDFGTLNVISKKSIDYDTVGKKLGIMRKKSMEFLKIALGEYNA